MNRRRATAVLAVVTVVSAFLIAGAHVASASQTQGSTLHKATQTFAATEVDSGYTSTVSIAFDNPAALQQAAVKRFLANFATLSHPFKPTPTPALSCKTGAWILTDTNGTMSLRNNCPYFNINWGFTVSPRGWR